MRNQYNYIVKKGCPLSCLSNSFSGYFRHLLRRQISNRGKLYRHFQTEALIKCLLDARCIGFLLWNRRLAPAPLPTTEHISGVASHHDYDPERERFLPPVPSVFCLVHSP
jgi:hypothetical protein